MKDLNELLRALYEGDREKEIHLNKDLSPLDVRDTYGKNLGEFVNKNYDITTPQILTPDMEDYYKWKESIGEPRQKPKNLDFKKLKQLFENQDNLKNTNLIHNDVFLDNLGARASYSPNKDLVTLTPNALSDNTKFNSSTSDILHELKHATEFQGPKTPVEKQLIDSMLNTNVNKDLNSYNNLKGLSNAERVLDNHHVGDSIFEREGLQRLLRGGKLGIAGTLGALGAGAMALGAGNKAMAGDIPGAALDAGAIVDPTGIAGAASQIRDRLNNPDYKKYSDADQLQALPPGLDIEQSAIQQNEDTPDNKFSKLKQMLGK